MRSRRSPSRGGATSARFASASSNSRSKQGGRTKNSSVPLPPSTKSPASPLARSRSVMTVDGYVSRAHAPHRSVPRDHAMLQDFGSYLEHRLHSRGLPTLRRIFADFLNEHEQTLGQFLAIGAFVIAVLPRERQGATHRRQAAFLLAKPKYTLDPRGCVFMYLNKRVATRNMVLLKRLFLEFLCHRETALLAFVARGSDAITVIPYALPLPGLQLQLQPQPRPEPEVQLESQTTALTAPDKQELQEQGPQELQEQGPQELQAKELEFEKMVNTPELTETQRNYDETLELSRSKKRDRSTLEKAQEAAVVVLEDPPVAKSSATTKHRREPERQIQAVRIQDVEEDEEGEEEEENLRPQSKVTATSTTSPKTTLKTTNRVKVTKTMASPSNKPSVKQLPSKEPSNTKQVKAQSPSTKLPSTKSPKKQRRIRKGVITLEKRLSVVHRLHELEAEAPWKSVFRALPLPFDETRHPLLSNQLNRFWRMHARAVWERNFWSPVTRETSSFEYNARNNRQLQAKAAFQTIIGDAYTELGAAFFLKLDAMQPGHPGWWYRRPIVALLSLDELQGQAACTHYMKLQAHTRFPDCGFPLPLKSPNYGSVRLRHAQATQSRAMWAYAHELAPRILREMAELQDEQVEEGWIEEADVERGPLLGL